MGMKGPGTLIPSSRPGDVATADATVSEYLEEKSSGEVGMALGSSAGSAGSTGPESACSALWKLIPGLFVGKQGWDQVTSLLWGSHREKGVR